MVFILSNVVSNSHFMKYIFIPGHTHESQYSIMLKLRKIAEIDYLTMKQWSIFM